MFCGLLCSLFSFHVPCFALPIYICDFLQIPTLGVMGLHCLTPREQKVPRSYNYHPLPSQWMLHEYGSPCLFMEVGPARRCNLHCWVPCRLRLRLGQRLGLKSHICFISFSTLSCFHSPPPPPPPTHTHTLSFTGFSLEHSLHTNFHLNVCFGDFLQKHIHASRLPICREPQSSAAQRSHINWVLNRV